MPERYALAEELIDQAIKDDNWTEIGKLSEEKKAANYKSVGFERDLCGEPYRFVVVHSSSLDNRKLKTLNSKIEKEKLELNKKAEYEIKREFFCKEDAMIEIEKFLRENKSKFHTFTSQIIELKKPLRGEGEDAQRSVKSHLKKKDIL